VVTLGLEVIPQFMRLLIKNDFESAFFMAAAQLVREMLSLQSYLPSSESQDENSLDYNCFCFLALSSEPRVKTGSD